MDLLATVRKEGSRGGTGDFKWSDVQGSARRENYLGHSVMAPVGRWQKGRDLNWYAKASDDVTEDAEAQAARERKEEIKRIKEAEEDALARALGLPVPDRSNPNLQPVGSKAEVNRIINDAAAGAGTEIEGGLGLTTSRYEGSCAERIVNERIEGNIEGQDKQLGDALKEYRRRHGNTKRRRSTTRSRSRDRHGGKHRDKDQDLDRNRRHRHDRHRRPSSTDRTHRHRRRSYSRSRSPERSHPRRRHRSRSKEANVHHTSTRFR